MGRTSLNSNPHNLRKSNYSTQLDLDEDRIQDQTRELASCLWRALQYVPTDNDFTMWKTSVERDLNALALLAPVYSLAIGTLALMLDNEAHIHSVERCLFAADFDEVCSNKLSLFPLILGASGHVAVMLENTKSIGNVNARLVAMQHQDSRLTDVVESISSQRVRCLYSSPPPWSNLDQPCTIAQQEFDKVMLQFQQQLRQALATKQNLKLNGTVHNAQKQRCHTHENLRSGIVKRKRKRCKPSANERPRLQQIVLPASHVNRKLTSQVDVATVLDKQDLHEDFFEMEKLLGYQVGTRGARKWKVHWKNYSAKEATWESEKQLKKDMGTAWFIALSEYHHSSGICIPS